MSRVRAAGFTLIEMIVALALLGAMMLAMYSGLSFGLRGWDASDVNGRRTADRRIAENFLRRELGEMFPMRWKDPMMLRFAFEGKTDQLRFVSVRPAGISVTGLSLVGISVEEDPTKQRAKNLVMRRASPGDEQKDFGPLAAGEGTILFENVESVAFSYYGAENDFTEPAWVDNWEWPGRMPRLVRVRVRASDGSSLPEMIVRMALGEEAGCLESQFQRVCRPRRDTT